MGAPRRKAIPNPQNRMLPHHGPAWPSIAPSALETMPVAAHQLLWAAGAERLVVICCRSPRSGGWSNGLLLRARDHYVSEAHVVQDEYRPVKYFSGK